MKKMKRILIFLSLSMAFVACGNSELEVQKAYERGYEQGRVKGYDEGYEKGRNDGYNEGYEAGISEEYFE